MYIVFSHFTKENKQMANKLNKCKNLQHSLSQRNYRLNQPWVDHFLPTIQRLILKRPTLPSDGKDVEKTGFSCITGSNVVGITTLENWPGTAVCQIPLQVLGPASLHHLLLVLLLWRTLTNTASQRTWLVAFLLRGQLKALSSQRG